MRNLVLTGFTLAGLLFAPTAFAGESGDELREHLYSGTIPAGLEALAPKAEGGDAEAKFAVGVLKFFSGVEHFAQALYRHGLAAPNTGMGPALSVPIARNENPEPLDYDTVREVLSTLVADMDAARDALLEAGESGDYAVLLDPARFRIDVNGDGMGDATESAEVILSQRLGMMDPGTPPPTDPAPGGGASQPGTGSLGGRPDMSLGFDRADAIWLAGYSQVFAAQGDFLLAHDFSEFVNSTFHRIFPQADLPMQAYAEGGMLVMDPQTDTAIADLIAGIHTLNWPVVEQERLQRVLSRLTAITQLSRENWDAIEAETDDNREFIPSPRQTPPTPEAVVTAEMVAAWRTTLDTVDQILAGDLLVPHWRFRQGFDLSAYFETAERTDLVMLITGYAAVPFLRDGPVANPETFAEADRVFGGNLINYAFWFN